MNLLKSIEFPVCSLLKLYFFNFFFNKDEISPAAETLTTVTYSSYKAHCLKCQFRHKFKIMNYFSKGSSKATQLI